MPERLADALEEMPGRLAGKSIRWAAISVASVGIGTAAAAIDWLMSRDSLQDVAVLAITSVVAYFVFRGLLDAIPDRRWLPASYAAIVIVSVALGWGVLQYQQGVSNDEHNALMKKMGENTPCYAYSPLPPGCQVPQRESPTQ